MLFSTKEIVHSLKQTALFKCLDGKTLRAVAERAVEQSFSRNAILFVAGEPSSGLFVIAKGSVRGIRTGADGREQIIFYERAPATIAEVPVFDDGVYFSTAVAEEETKAYFFEKSYIRALCLENPLFALTALKVLGQLVRNLAGLIEELALCEVGERLVHFLLSEADNKGENINAEIHLKLDLTRAQIAARIGTVREVVSRNLTHLQSEGLIRLENHHVIITDKAKLAQYANNGKE